MVQINQSKSYILVILHKLTDPEILVTWHKLTRIKPEAHGQNCIILYICDTSDGQIYKIQPISDTCTCLNMVHNVSVGGGILHTQLLMHNEWMSYRNFVTFGLSIVLFS